MSNDEVINVIQYPEIFVYIIIDKRRMAVTEH